jgi:isoquinoline 1-oxidoreductase subunit beta
MKKRTFLIGTLAAGSALVVGWGLMPPRQRLQGAMPLALKDGQIALNAWLRLDTDGRVGLVMPRSEMGQGVHTGLSMLVAEELDCAMSQIRIDPSPIDKIYGNVAGLAEGVPFHPDDQGVVARSMRWTMLKVMREMGFMMTGGSASIKDLWIPLREASAMTRASLVNAAARHWSVSASEIKIEQGVFSHASGKSLPLGELIKQLGNKIEPASTYALKDPAQFRLIGKPIPRIDSAAKVNATAGFSIDTVVPGMLYAALTMSPTLGGVVASVDSSVAQKMPGVRKVAAAGLPSSPSITGRRERPWKRSKCNGLQGQWPACPVKTHWRA